MDRSIKSDQCSLGFVKPKTNRLNTAARLWGSPEFFP
jgi:hypothetical protein